MADDTVHGFAPDLSAIVPGTGEGMADVASGPVVVLDEVEPAAAPDPDVVVLAPEGSEDDKLPAHAQLQDDGSVILPLRYPVTMRYQRGSGTVREVKRDTLHMHRLNGAAVRAIEAAQGNTVATGVAHSCRMHGALFNALWDRMDAFDNMAAGQVLSFFLFGGKTAAGRPSSPA